MDSSVERTASKSAENVEKTALPPQPEFLPKIVFYNIRHSAKKLSETERHGFLTIKQYAESRINDNDNGVPSDSCFIMIFSFRFLHKRLYQPVYAIQYSTETTSDKTIVEALVVAWYLIIKDLETLNLHVIATISTHHHLFQMALKIIKEKDNLNSLEYIKYSVVPNRLIIHMYDMNCLCSNLEKEIFNSDLTYFLRSNVNELEWQIASAADIKTYIKDFPDFLDNEPFLFDPITYYAFLMLQEEGKIARTETLGTTTTLLSICCVCVAVLQVFKKMTAVELRQLYDTLEPLRLVLASIHFTKNFPSENTAPLNNITEEDNIDTVLKAKEFYMKQLTMKSARKVINVNGNWKVTVLTALLSLRHSFLQLLSNDQDNKNARGQWKRKPLCIRNYQKHIVDILFECGPNRSNINHLLNNEFETKRTITSNSLNNIHAECSQNPYNTKRRVSKKLSLAKALAFQNNDPFEQNSSVTSETQISIDDDFEKIYTVFNQLPKDCIRSDDSIPWQQTLNGFLLLSDNLVENGIDSILTNVFSNDHNDYFVGTFEVDTNYEGEIYELLTFCEATNVVSVHLNHLK